MFSKFKRNVWYSLVIALFCFASPNARAQTVNVVSSGGFAAAYKLLAPRFEKATGIHLETVWGPSMGTTHGAIPMRLARREPLDVVIMVGYALDGLIQKGEVQNGSQVVLARSPIAMAVRAGAPVPDIGTVAALRRTLLQARSVAYSDSASGAYISSTLFQRLGIEKEMAPKSRKIPATPVGLIVARGEAQIGFQQMSELLPIPGITIVGPIPDKVQKITLFSTGIVATSKSKNAGRALIRFLSSPAACAAIRQTGLDPVACSRSHSRILNR